MALVVEDQARALWESLFAGDTVFVDKVALKHRLLGVSSAFDTRDGNFLVGVRR